MSTVGRNEVEPVAGDTSEKRFKAMDIAQN